MLDCRDHSCRYTKGIGGEFPLVPRIGRTCVKLIVEVLVVDVNLERRDSNYRSILPVHGLNHPLITATFDRIVVKLVELRCGCKLWTRKLCKWMPEKSVADSHPQKD